MEPDRRYIDFIMNFMLFPKKVVAKARRRRKPVRVRRGKRYSL